MVGFILFIALLLCPTETGAMVCQQQTRLSDTRGFIRSPNYPQYSQIPVCYKWFFPTYISRVTFSFEDFDLPHRPWEPCENYIRIESALQNTTIDSCRVKHTLPFVHTAVRGPVTVTYNYSQPSPSRGFSLAYVTSTLQWPNSCSDDEYQCSNYRCIFLKWRCNGVDECGDNSDEHGCINIKPVSPPSDYSCTQPTFGCVSRNDQQYRCYPSSYLCDGENHCLDGMDESQCRAESANDDCYYFLNARFGHFSSSNFPYNYPRNSHCTYQIQVTRGKRVQLRFKWFQLERGDKLIVYDGPTVKYDKRVFTQDIQPPAVLEAGNDTVLVKFMSDGSYEDQGFNITFQEKGSCLPGQWPCKWSEDDCYDATRHCDGHWDCPLHGGDERGCSPCKSHLFKCRQSTKCYSESERCNGIHKCVDKSDETDCNAQKCNVQNGTFLCDNGRCIYESWVCDHADDCRDGSDEHNCSSAPSRRVITAAVIGSLLCALLLVIAIGCTCKLHARRMSQMMGSYARYMTPMCEVEQEIWARQSAPPLYDEAMRTSRPFEEAHREMLARAAALELPRDQAPAPITAQMLSEALEAIPSVPLHNSAEAAAAAAAAAATVALSDDELIDLTAPVAQAPAADVDDVQLTVSAGAKAQWRRSLSKSRSSSCGEGPSDERASPSPHCDSSHKSGSSHVPDAVQMQFISPHKTLARTADVHEGADASGGLNEDSACSRHSRATTNIDTEDTACDNEAFIDDHDDELMLPRPMARPVDGASIAESSDTSLLDGDGDVSMLSLD